MVQCCRSSFLLTADISLRSSNPPISKNPSYNCAVCHCVPQDKHHTNHANILIYDTALVLQHEIVMQRIPRLRESEVEMAEECAVVQSPSVEQKEATTAHTRQGAVDSRCSVSNDDTEGAQRRRIEKSPRHATPPSSVVSEQEGLQNKIMNSSCMILEVHLPFQDQSSTT